MGVAISGLAVATDIAEADQLEIAQSAVSKSITKQLLRRKLFSDSAYSFPLPVVGDSLVFNGTDWIPGPRAGWRTIPQEAYTESAVASSSTITFAGGGDVNGIQMGASDYVSVGLPVRVIISGTSYYGICTAVTDTLLTITGMILPTATAITSLAVGTLEMVKHVNMTHAATGYQAVTSNNLIHKGLIHLWRGATGYFVSGSLAQQNSGAGNIVNFRMNAGSNVLTTGITVTAGGAATYGAFAHSGNGNVIAANAAIADGQTVTVFLTTAGGAGDYLVACLTFIVP